MSIFWAILFICRSESIGGFVGDRFGAEIFQLQNDLHLIISFTHNVRLLSEI